MMESAAALRSFHYPVGTITPFRSAVERPCVVSMHNATWLTSNKSLSAIGLELVSSSMKRAGALVSCMKTSDDAVVDDDSNGSLEKSTPRDPTFPRGFEELVMGVCDDTQIAELKMKIGDFELHLKRDIKSAETPMPVAWPTPPPTPSKPMTESGPAAPASPPSSSSEKLSPFINVPVEKTQKLKALEASGASGYVIVSSPAVGVFRRGAIRDGEMKPPCCKEGQVIKEGQILGFVHQIGKVATVRSDTAGEVLKVLYVDGEAIGYGDPVVAVFPHFHDV